MKFIKEGVMWCFFITATKSLSNDFLIIILVIKFYHPSEVMTYIEQFKNLRNVKVVHEGNVIKWILASDAVSALRCTTGVESLRLTNQQHLLQSWINQLMLGYQSKLAKLLRIQDELIGLVKRNLNQNEGQLDKLTYWRNIY